MNHTTSIKNWVARKSKTKTKKILIRNKTRLKTLLKQFLISDNMIKKHKHNTTRKKHNPQSPKNNK